VSPELGEITVIELVLRDIEEVAAAFAGVTVPNSPSPKAETTTSARRLKFVFVDICFLSLVDPEDFSRSAW